MAKQKTLESYLIDAPASAHKTSLNAYLNCPASTLLTYICDAHDSFFHCKNKFTKLKSGKYNKDSEDSLHYISCAILGTVMGYFETYQKTLFAGLVEMSSIFPGFAPDKFLENFKKNNIEISIPVIRLLAFRTLNAPVGLVLAEALSGWHNPGKVNTFFKIIGCKQDLFSPDDVSDIEVLWQLRHSIVHTGAWLTLPDAQKVKRLSRFGDKPIVFDHAFIDGMARRMHIIIREANKRILASCTTMLGSAPDAASIDKLQNFLAVNSPKNTWIVPSVKKPKASTTPTVPVSAPAAIIVPPVV